MTVIEIENDNGETLGYFRTKQNITFEDIVCSENFSLADETGDYLTHTKDNLIRIQFNKLYKEDE